MKKGIFFSLLAVSVILSACSSSQDSSVSQESTKPSEPIVAETQRPRSTSDDTPGVKPKMSPEQSKVRASMLDMMKKGIPMTCTFSNQEEGTKIDATMQVDGKKIGYIGKGKMDGKEIEMRMVMKDGFTYSWTNMQPGAGFKMKANLDENPADTKDSEMGAEEFHKEFDFDCREGVEATAFDLPADVKFQEFAMPTLPVVQ